MSRKQSVFIRCDGDGCKEFAEVDSLTETPAKWYRIHQADEMGKTPSGGFDFHSLRCVEKWAVARRRALEPSTPSNGFARNGAAGVAIHAAIRDGFDWEEPFSSRDLQELSGASQNTVDKYLRDFLDDGSLVLSGEGVNGRDGRTFAKVNGSPTWQS